MSTTVLDATPAIQCAIRRFSATVRHMLDGVDMEAEPDALNVQRRLHDFLAGYSTAMEADPIASSETWMVNALYGISANAPGYRQACELFCTVITQDLLNEFRREVDAALAAAALAAAARAAALQEASV